MRRAGLFVLAAVTAIVLSAEMALSVPIFGVGPDLLIVVVAAFAATERPRIAAAGGFGAGLVRDLLLTTPNGLSALAYAVTAFGVSLVGASRGVWAFVALVAAATFLSQVIFGVGVMFLAPEVALGPVPRVVFLTTAYNTLLAPLLMPILQRIAPLEEAGARGGTE